MQGARAQLPASAPVQQGAPRGAIAMPPIKKAATARARNAAKGRAALRSKQRLVSQLGGGSRKVRTSSEVSGVSSGEGLNRTPSEAL